jgi:hypothetical protein
MSASDDEVDNVLRKALTAKHERLRGNIADVRQRMIADRDLLSGLEEQIIAVEKLLGISPKPSYPMQRPAAGSQGDRSVITIIDGGLVKGSSFAKPAVIDPAVGNGAFLKQIIANLMSDGQSRTPNQIRYDLLERGVEPKRVSARTGYFYTAIQRLVKAGVLRRDRRGHYTCVNQILNDVLEQEAAE